MALTPEEIERINSLLDKMDQSRLDRVMASFSSFISWLRSINWDDVANKLIKAFELLEKGISVATAIADFFARFF